jgi:hypothetical protein
MSAEAFENCAAILKSAFSFAVPRRNTCSWATHPWP